MRLVRTLRSRSSSVGQEPGRLGETPVGPGHVETGHRLEHLAQELEQRANLPARLGAMVGSRTRAVGAKDLQVDVVGRSCRLEAQLLTQHLAQRRVGAEGVRPKTGGPLRQHERADCVLGHRVLSDGGAGQPHGDLGVTPVERGGRCSAAALDEVTFEPGSLGHHPVGSVVADQQRQRRGVCCLLHLPDVRRGAGRRPEDPPRLHEVDADLVGAQQVATRGRGESRRASALHPQRAPQHAHIALHGGEIGARRPAVPQHLGELLLRHRHPRCQREDLEDLATLRTTELTRTETRPVGQHHRGRPEQHDLQHDPPLSVTSNDVSFCVARTSR